MGGRVRAHLAAPSERTLGEQTVYPFERFTEDAKRTLTLAQEEAERSRQSYIGTEHLLLGLLRIESGIAYRVVTGFGISTDSVRQTIQAVLGRNEGILIQSIIPTSRVKKVIEISFEEARRMGHNSVDTGHLLLGLVIEGEGIAAHVLADLGATPERVMAEVQREMGAPTSARHKAGRGKRSLFGRPIRSTFGTSPMPTAPIDLRPNWTTDASELARLLRSPRIAKLLKAKGLDTEALSALLSEPPAKFIELQNQLAYARFGLSQAAATQDFELAAKLQDEVKNLLEKLEKAESDWLDSL